MIVSRHLFLVLRSPGIPHVRLPFLVARPVATTNLYKAIALIEALGAGVGEERVQIEPSWALRLGQREQSAAMPAEAAAALFQVVAQRYGKGSIALTTNLGIASWGRIFDDTAVAAAMLDRLLHRSVVFNIDGDSSRMRAHRARAEQVRKGVVVRSGG